MNCPFYEKLRSELKQSFDSFTCLFNCDHDDIFITLMSANNGDHEFVKKFCKYVNLGFQLRFDHLNSARLWHGFCLIIQKTGFTTVKAGLPP